MKKFLCSLLILTCMFGLTACNGEKKTLSFDESLVESQCESLYSEIVKNYEDGKDTTISNYTEYQLDDFSEKMYEDYQIHISGATYISSIDSYVNATDEMGTITKADKIEFDAKEDELIVTYYLNGSSHNGSIEIIYDKNLTITSVTTNIDYSFDELMVKAGVNTAIGMGTVFVMLIVIMIIIMILGLVPKIFEKKPKNTEAKKDGVDKAIEGIVAREEASEEADDTELVAVIAAAIAAYEGTSTDGFVVRSIKRIK